MEGYEEWRDETYTWWHVEDGVARAYPECGEVLARIDNGEPGWYASPVGCILHGGVIATAFKRKVEQTYDAMHWLVTGEYKPAGEITITEIIAERAA